MQAYARTDIGCVRKMNQDVFFYTTQPIGPLPNLFIVADGMGGHRAGDFAARYAIDVCVESIKNSSHASPIKALDEAVKLANSMVFEKSETNTEYQGMGTTMVLCFIESGQLYVANVGDSRLYLLGDGLSQVTEDHSYVAAMVRAGEITEEEARIHPDKNMITRAIGVCETVRIDYFEVDLKSGDRILLIHLPDTHESVAGIIAGRLRENYNRPVLVVTGKGDIVKGSGRSIPAYNLYEGLEACRDLLEKFGGHAMAAGFSLQKANLPALGKALNGQCGLTDADLLPTVQLDAPMPPEYVTPERIRQWEGLGPFGKGCPQPLFGRSGLSLESIRVLGQNRNALRLRFRGESGKSFEGIWFGDVRIWEKFLSETFGEKCFTMLERGQTKVRVALAYEPVLHEYEGRWSIQFQIRHFHA